MPAIEKFDYSEALKHLAEEIKAIMEESKFQASELVIKTNHLIGEAITKHPAYKKGKHGSGDIIKHLALLTGCSEAHLYLCIKFVEKYPEVSNALETLQPDKKTLTWRQITATFKEAEEEGKEVGNEPGQIKGCRHLHIKTITICVDCGSRVDDRKKEHVHAAHT
ncbi:MAG: hypothetical protein M1383_04440 [Patescibacteria group bacterium]|nr:hypothetical protein [Patescibacteria group bacterium]